MSKQDLILIVDQSVYKENLPVKRRIFISTGEVSGDLQGALLAQALNRVARERGIDLDLLGLGGDRMAAAGVTLLSQTTAIGSIGIWESLPYVLPTLKLQNQASRFLLENPTDALILLDYMGPNIALGQRVKRQFPEIPIFYYIAPQEWVWTKGSRNTSAIVSFCEQILAVFPGEAQYYQSQGAAVTWVGHPLLDTLGEKPTRLAARQALGLTPDEPMVALLPASRRQELRYLLPILLDTAQAIYDRLPQTKFYLPLSQAAFGPIVADMLKPYGMPVQVVTQSTETIAAADLAITKSGTVNLELALQAIPQVVFYRVSRPTAWIARQLLNFSIPFMSPPNLVLMEEIVPELLQEEATADRLTQEALQLLGDTPQRQTMLAGYDRLRQALGEPGVCDRAAKVIFDALDPK